MKAKVIENLCIGCGACEGIAPEEFRINDNGISEAINDEVKDENKEKVLDAKETCPTGAIEVKEE